AGVVNRCTHPPNACLGVRKSFQVPLDGDLVPVTSDQLVQAAWAQLVELTDQWRGRNPTACSKGRFTRAVGTYPTVAPPSGRREGEKLLRELKFPHLGAGFHLPPHPPRGPRLVRHHPPPGVRDAHLLTPIP